MLPPPYTTEILVSECTVKPVSIMSELAGVKNSPQFPGFPYDVAHHALDVLYDEAELGQLLLGLGDLSFELVDLNGVEAMTFLGGNGMSVRNRCMRVDNWVSLADLRLRTSDFGLERRHLCL